MNSKDSIIPKESIPTLEDLMSAWDNLLESAPKQIPTNGFLINIRTGQRIELNNNFDKEWRKAIKEQIKDDTDKVVRYAFVPYGFMKDSFNFHWNKY